MIVKKHVVISGKVQGVGFRYWIQNLAVNNNITGWVKNKLSGDVEALIVGHKKKHLFDLTINCSPAGFFYN